MAIFKVPKKPKEQRLAKLSPAQRAEIDRIEADAIADFKGQLDDVESALGMLRIRSHFGWKVLYLIYSRFTIRKYEGILKVKIGDLFPDEGPSAYRSLGLDIANAASNFRKVISGDARAPRRGMRSPTTQRPIAK